MWRETGRQSQGDNRAIAMRFLFPVGVFVVIFLIWLFFRSGGYKRQPLEAP